MGNLLSSITNGNNDPRVGSGRQGSSGGTISTTSQNKSDSLKNLGATFIPISILLGVCLALFLVLRPRLNRVYAPRTFVALRAPERASPELPSGLFKWIKPFFKNPDSFVLNYGSLDGFFFLRYLKVIRNICLVGCLITWPVLFPINATGGKGQVQLEMLTMGNIANPTKFYAHVLISWILFGFILFTVVRECIYYVNIRQAYLSSPYYADRLSSKTLMLQSVPDAYLDERRLRKLYGDTVRRIWIPRASKALVNMVKEREQTAQRLEKAEIKLITKANQARKKYLRAHPHAAQNEAKYAVPAIDEESTIEKDGDSDPPSSKQSAEQAVDRVRQGSGSSSGLVNREAPASIANDETIEPPLELQATLEPEKDDMDAHEALQNSEEHGITIVNENEKKEHEQDTEEDLYTHPYGLDPNLPDVRGSVAAQWVKAEQRPYHRPIGNFGRRVDTIRWARMRIKDLNQQIHLMRKRVRRGDAGSALPVAFIEFESQEAAQAASQIVAHHRPLQMSPRLLGVRPDEVIWSALRMSWWERIGRRFAMMCLITAAIIFWSIPSAIISIISQISFLEKIPFLNWIKYLPVPILSFIQGFIPAAALSIFMALVPMMLRACARTAGVPTAVLVELFSQHGYFAFQVVQVFLITTLTQAASGSFINILENPLSAREVLAKNLPTASNFYLSYILIQCLATGAFRILNILELIRHIFLRQLSQTPRARYNAWLKLRVVHWGGVFPVFSNMGVIACCYGIIAPLILIFAAVGMTFMHAVWKYNLTYVYSSSADSKGLFYPRALMHLMIGLYLAEICLVGLFGLNLAYGPMVLMALFFVFTGIVHMSLREAISPLLLNLPQTLKMEEDIQLEEKAAAQQEEEDRVNDPHAGGEAANYYDEDQDFGEGEMRDPDEDDSSESEVEEDDGVEHGPVTGSRALEGAGDVRSTVFAFLKAGAKKQVQTQVEESGISRALSKVGWWNESTRKPEAPPGFLVRWLHPEIYEDFVALRKLIPTEGIPTIAYGSRREQRQMRQQAEYTSPEMWTPKPTLWIPRDEARVSRQEVAHTRPSAPIHDTGAELDKKGRLVVNLDASPLREPRLIL